MKQYVKSTDLYPRSSDQKSALKTTLLQLAELPDSEFDFLWRHAQRKTYQSGRALLDLGVASTQFWYLLSGFLRFYYLTESGREYNKAFCRPGEVVMSLPAVLDRAPSEFVIAAITKVEVVAFPTSIIPVLYERHPAWERIGRVLAEQMALRKEARERELLLDSALVRFQRFADRYPELVDWIPQRQIASYIGVTEQALSRLLREWRLTQG